MLRYGRLRFLLDTVPEGVLVTVVHDHDGFVCEVVDRDAHAAVMAALEAAQASEAA